MISPDDNPPETSDRTPSRIVPVGMSTDRLEAFSDGVFAIVITLLVLDLHVSPSRHLAHDLVMMWPALLGYVVSFLIVGVVWLNHHTMFHYITQVDRTLLILNLLLLMSVAVLPLPTGVLAESISDGVGKNAAAVFYGGTLVLGGIFFNALWLYASTGHRLLGQHISPAHARSIRLRFAIGPALYLVATVVGFVSAEASLGMYVVLLAFYMAEASVQDRQDDARARRRFPRKVTAAAPTAAAPTAAAPTAAAPSVSSADRDV